MNIIYFRHGESTDNVKELISDKEIYWSTLTEKGIESVIASVNALPDKLDKCYVSPLPRTIQTAHFVAEKYPTAEVIIEDRIREIQYGKYSGKKNNEELDSVRKKQIDGDYFVRFGDYGENKMEIETRLSMFLKDLKESNYKNSTIAIVSHGSIISYMKRILAIKTVHIKTGATEIFYDIDFSPLYKNIKILKNIMNKNESLLLVKPLDVNENKKSEL